MSGRPRRNPGKPIYWDHQYRKKTSALRSYVKRTGAPCWLCGNPIDLTLPYTHPMSFTADHVDALGNGGKALGELRAAHRSCNSRRGKRRTIEQIAPPATTRKW